MGNQAIILIAGTLILVTVYIFGFMGISNEISKNSGSSYAHTVAKEINTSALEMAMRTLADSTKWRAPFTNLQLSGGTTTVTFKDTLVSGDSCVVVRSSSRYVSGNDTARASARVIVSPVKGFVPPIVRAAFTAFGPLNDAISDMLIDGRAYRRDGISTLPRVGKFAVSTGQSTFVNNDKAALGGTTYVTNPPTDIPTAFPHDQRVVETSSSWPDGWPMTPDAALNIAEGTLKQIAQKKLIPGSQYVTTYSQLVFPLRGVTFIEVPSGTEWSKRDLGNNPEGILVFRSLATNAFWNNISTKAGAFKGLMIFDNVFHIHMNILGALVVLTPNTIVGRNCNGNAGHWIRYSSETIIDATAGISDGGTTAGDGGGWKSRWKVLSWYE